MPIVLIKCPRTGQRISTGIEAASLESLPGGPAPAHCPFCGKDHFWAKGDAVLVARDRWSDAPKVEDCFLKAMQSAERAATATTEDDRDHHLRMERKWLGLANGYRFIAEVDRRQGTD